MSTAGQSESDSGGRPDSCQTVPACPLPPCPERLETSKGPAAPSPPAHAHPFRSGDSGSPERVKKFAQLGHLARRGRGACPDGRGRSRLPVPRRGSAPGRGRGGGFPGSAGPAAFPSSGSLVSSGAVPERRAGVPGPLPEGCGAPARPRGVRARSRRSPAARRPRATRRPAGPRRRASRRHRPRPGRDRPARLAHLNLDLRRGMGAASPQRAFSSAPATAGWGRAREAGAAAGQSRSAFRTLPGNRGDLRASPHPARLLAAFPPRPSSGPPIPARRRLRLRGGAWSPTPPPELPRPLQSGLAYDGQTPGPVGRGWEEPLGPKGWAFILLIRPRPRPLHLPPRFLGGSPAPWGGPDEQPGSRGKMDTERVQSVGGGRQRARAGILVQCRGRATQGGSRLGRSRTLTARPSICFPGPMPSYPKNRY